MAASFIAALVATAFALLFWAERRRSRVRVRGSEDREAARARTFAELAAALGHEVRNPLNTLGLTLDFLGQLLGSQPLDAERRAQIERHLCTGTGEVEKIRQVVEAFLELSRPRPLAVEDLDLSALVAHAIEAERTRRQGRAAGVELALDADPVPASVDRRQIGEALAAVIGNALETAREAPNARIEVRCAPNPEGRAEIVVRNAGRVSSLLDGERAIFAALRDGAGFGLARARAIVEAHGGRVEACDEGAGRGAEVHIELPMTATRKHGFRD